MLIRHPVKTALGSVLAIAILAAPGVASAQSLFGTPAPDTSSTRRLFGAARRICRSAGKAAKKARRQEGCRESLPCRTAASKVNVINNRDATLVELSVTSTTAKDAKPQVVAHDLKSGQKVSAQLAKNGGCIYDVSGTFDDQFDGRTVRGRLLQGQQSQSRRMRSEGARRSLTPALSAICM